jgi:hypothetical protein
LLIALEIEEVRWRKRDGLQSGPWHVLVQSHETLRLGKPQRSKERRVDDAEGGRGL